MESGKRVYRDANGNVGFFKDLYARPYYGLKRVQESVDQGNRWSEVDYTSFVKVMESNGVRLESGKRYKLTFDVYPYSRVRDVRFTGPVHDIVGKDSFRKCFVVNPEEQYDVFGARPCAQFTVRTADVRYESDNLSVIPSFESYVPEIDAEVKTLESRIRDLPTDMSLYLPIEGDEPRVFKVHSFIVRSCTVYFDTASSFKDDSHIELSDKYSVEAWTEVVEYMYKPIIKTNDIGVIQEMIQIGDEYQIHYLTCAGTRRIRDFVEDGVTSNEIPWVISIISMACHFVARHDPAYENDMVELCKSAIFLVHSRSHDLLQDLDFVEAYSEILPLLREMESIIQARNVGLAEFARKPISILGKRKWV